VNPYASYPVGVRNRAKGWRGQSDRHRLAAYGISTGNSRNALKQQRLAQLQAYQNERIRENILPPSYAPRVSPLVPGPTEELRLTDVVLPPPEGPPQPVPPNPINPGPIDEMPPEPEMMGDEHRRVVDDVWGDEMAPVQPAGMFAYRKRWLRR
jgi:hypothetical protein